MWRIPFFLYFLLSGYVIIVEPSIDNTAVPDVNEGILHSHTYFTKNDIEEFLDVATMSDFIVSLDDLRFFSLNESRLAEINKNISILLKICDDTCGDAQNPECYYNILNEVYSIVQEKIDSDDTLHDKKAEHCSMLISYLLSHYRITDFFVNMMQ